MWEVVTAAPEFRCIALARRGQWCTVTERVCWEGCTHLGWQNRALLTSRLECVTLPSSVALN